jgi:hypothetical protein
MLRPRAVLIATTARTISSSPVSVPRPDTNDRSIFTPVTGKRRR